MHAHDPELAQIGWNIDPLPARQHDIARKHPQMPIFPAATFDDISGADGKTLGQRTGLAVNWQTHGNPSSYALGISKKSNIGNVGKFRLFPDGRVTVVDCCG
jgi:hypothetical protein